MGKRLKLFFRTIISVDQLSIYWASLRFAWRIQSLPCKNGETCHGRTIWPIVRANKFVDENTYIFDRCQSTKNEWKGYHNKIVWLSFVLMQDSWQQLTSDSTSWQKTLKNSHNLQNQWHVVSTRCQEMKNYLTRKCWKSQPATYEVNVERKIRIESVNTDNSHSWVRISHGLNKVVTDLSNKEDDDNEQETSEMQFEDFALKTNVLAFASRSKAKAKPRRRTPACSSTRTVPISERSWTDIEPENYSSIAYPV